MQKGIKLKEDTRLAKTSKKFDPFKDYFFQKTI